MKARKGFYQRYFMPAPCAGLLLCLFFLFPPLLASAQNNMVDTTRGRNAPPAADSVQAAESRKKPRKARVYRPDSTHSPRKAVFRSLVVPGWGQLYNKRWWKVPLVYGGLTSLGLAIEFNQRYYRQYLLLAQRSQRNEVLEPPFNRYPTETFITVKDQYKRNRDLSIIGVGGFWAIQVVEAYIDAKFQHSYSMDDNLSFKVRPALLPQPVYAFTPQPPVIAGISLVFTLR